LNSAISDVVVGCPTIYLEYAKNQAPENIQVAAQNAYKVPSGAFTGKIILFYFKCLDNFIASLHTV
jgi:triosephosphate isomerase